MRYLIIILMAVLSVNAYAQNGATISLAMTAKNAAGTAVAADTTVDADTTYLNFKSSSPYDLLVKLTNTKISGTVAGTVYFEGSDDNSVWFTLASVNTGTISSQFVEDTLTLTNATATHYWLYGGSTAHKYGYYRLRIVTSGTQAAAPTATVYYRKP